MQPELDICTNHHVENKRPLPSPRREPLSGVGGECFFWKIIPNIYISVQEECINFVIPEPLLQILRNIFLQTKRFYTGSGTTYDITRDTLFRLTSPDWPRGTRNYL